MIVEKNIKKPYTIMCFQLNFNYKAIINLLFHFEKAGRVIMFTHILEKINKYLY